MTGVNKNNLVADIIKCYTLSEPVRSQIIRESTDNVVYLIGSKDKKILRLSKRLPVQDIQFEFEVFDYLTRNNFPIPKWNKTKDGKLLVEAENIIAVLFDFLEGYQVKIGKDNLPNKDQAHTAGKYLALMHNASLGFKTDFPRKRNIFSEMERAINTKQIFIDKFKGGKDFIKQVEEAVEFGEKDKSIKGLVHNDYRSGNVLFKNDNEISGVIDFDWSCNGPTIKDLALAVVEWSFPDERIEPDWELFDTFLAGYNSVAKTKYEKGELLYSWIKFACISDACTYFCDLVDSTVLEKKITKSYMYRKHIFFKNFKP